MSDQIAPRTIEGLRSEIKKRGIKGWRTEQTGFIEGHVALTASRRFDNGLLVTLRGSIPNVFHEILSYEDDCG